MSGEIQKFTEYLSAVKHASPNTVASYQSDLMKMVCYAKSQGVERAGEVRPTLLNAYVLELERKGLASSSISRYVASIKAFFEYEFREHRIPEDPAYLLKAPKVERHLPGILSVEEMGRILEQPDVSKAKGSRDKAMLELLYATGLRVSELISLRLSDVNLRFGWVVCRDGEKERMVPFGASACKALMAYMDSYRNSFLKKGKTDFLFLNCSGAPISRQGFWKVLKGYAGQAGIQKAITPRMFRHSCAAHMAANGAELTAIQKMLGYSDLTMAQVYASFQSSLKTEYSKVHPRG